MGKEHEERLRTCFDDGLAGAGFNLSVHVHLANHKATEQTSGRLSIETRRLLPSQAKLYCVCGAGQV